jgi:hypothetical protein
MLAGLKHRSALLLPLLPLLMAVIILFVPAVSFVVTQTVDYQLHQDFVSVFLYTGDLRHFITTVPHFLFHLLAVILVKLLSVSMMDGFFGAAMIFYCLMAIALYSSLVWFLGKPTRVITGLFYGVTAVLLMLVMPINMFTPTNLYLGYIPIHAYHNPTIVALKPFALVLFMLVVRVFDGKPVTHPRRFIAFALVVTVMSILAKPSYMLALLPALIIFSLVAYWRRWPVKWRLLIGGIVLPALSLLGIQALLFASNSHIIIAPFAVMDAWAERINPLANRVLLLKFLLSILFPLLVYLFYFKTAFRKMYLNLAWLTFGFGALINYGLAEAEPRLADGNFTWTGQITLFILFVASAIFFVEQIRVLIAERNQLSLKPLAFALGLFVFWLHLWSGILWYQVHVTSTYMGNIVSGIW